MKNIFEFLHPSFFNVLTGENKLIHTDLLMQLQRIFELNLNPFLNKDDVIEVFSSYFENEVDKQIIDENNEDISLKSPKEKAYAKYNLFRNRGWIHEDPSENYSMMVQLDNQAIIILRAFDEITKSEKSKEYTGYLLNILNSFKSFPEENGIVLLEQIENTVKSLMDQLKGLTNKIQKYIKDLQFNEENANKLMQKLLTNYQKEVIDQGFTNLKQGDHPSKYKNLILNQIDRWLGQHLHELINNYRDVKRVSNEIDDSTISYEITERVNLIRERMEELPKLVTIIDQKNSQYVLSVTERIRFLIQESKNVQGLLEQCLKFLKDVPSDRMFEFSIYSQKMVNQDSLYFPPRPANAVIPLQTLQSRDVDEQEFALQQQRFLQDLEWTAEAINQYVVDHLNGQPWIKASMLPYHSITDIIRSLWIQLYSTYPKVRYTLEPLDESLLILGFQFNDFVLRPKGVNL